MSKTLKKAVTLILALVMVFGMSAVTISAASDVMVEPYTESGSDTSAKGEGAGSETGTSSEETGSVVTGWCDVAYDTATNKITVVITPDKSAP